MRTFCSETHARHFPRGELSGGELVRPFECPERWEYVRDALIARELDDIHAPGPIDSRALGRIHSPDYLQFLDEAWDAWVAEGFAGDALPTVFPTGVLSRHEPRHIEGRLGHFSLAAETAITSGTRAAAYSSAACAASAQQHVSAGNRVAFALCRPPGHHAEAERFGGYCFLNNAALAADGLREAGAARVAILDVDFHHGNGTQSIFYDREDVYFASLHGDPEDAFPHFWGYAEETGRGVGQGYTANYPMPPGTGYAAWSVALDDALERIEACGAEALVVSLGVDTFERDPISFFRLTSDDFTLCGQRIGKSGLPTVFVMEGGYAVEEIGINTTNVLAGFLDT